MPPTAWIAIAVFLLTQTGVLAFMLGRLSQRVSAVEKESEGHGDLSDKVTRLIVQQEHANATLTKLVNNSENVNRQLGNIAMGRVGQGIETGGRND